MKPRPLKNQPENTKHRQQTNDENDGKQPHEYFHCSSSDLSKSDNPLARAPESQVQMTCLARRRPRGTPVCGLLQRDEGSRRLLNVKEARSGFCRFHRR